MCALIKCLPLVLLLPALPAMANVNAAARAFQDGQSAQLEGNHELAARNFELADSIIPAKEALRAAARARMMAGQLARAATHAEALIARYPDDEPCRQLAVDILKSGQPKLTKVKVRCEAPCSVALGGRALLVQLTTDHVFYLEPGQYSVEVSFDSGEGGSRIVSGKAGEEVELRFEAPKPARTSSPARADNQPANTEQPAEATTAETVVPPPEAHVDTGGITPVVFWVGLGTTVAAGGAALWSAMDTSSAHDDYVASPTAQGWEDGRTKQTRTNVLWIAAGVCGVATAIIPFFTDWGGKTQELSVAVGAEGASIGWSGRF